MPSRTQIVCLHEGKKGRSIDPLFIRALIRKLDPAWIRPWKGNNVIRTIGCGGRPSLIDDLPREIKNAEQAGGATTVLVWADMDDDMASPEQLKAAFRTRALECGVSRDQFDRVVFAFSKDRLENWIEFLNTGTTDETREGPRVTDSEAVMAAKKLADICLRQVPAQVLPPSLEWSCRNWRALRERMS